ncbi:MAG: methyltransferase domain-containing protein [Acetobacteraceae bacterium]|nr:methyltransferase domain-containing protein [Acetobacteraceae bacterium]MBV8588509.1 methyltransferase domain-containing protein [Acetobacteraceae bacterium]
MPKTQESLVADQFGSQAAAYLQSTVHAQGEDLQKLAGIVQGHAGARVLDLGCGGGHVSYAVAPHVGEVVAYDLLQEMLEIVGRAAAERGLTNISTRQGAAEQLPFADAAFDFVFSRYSAHHWRDFDIGLREAARVLKPGRIVAFIDVVSPGQPVLDTYLQAVEILRDPSHVRDYSRAEWDAALARSGLRLGPVRAHRVRLEFASWVARMRTPVLHVEAIRSLQAVIADDVRRHFQIESDGSFTVDVALLEAAKAIPG